MSEGKNVRDREGGSGEWGRSEGKVREGTGERGKGKERRKSEGKTKEERA